MTLEIIKVCGLRTLESIKYCVSDESTRKITHLGIICVPNRKRTIDESVAVQVQGLINGNSNVDSGVEGMRNKKKLVGVFRNQSFQDMEDLAVRYQLDAIQFHDDNKDWFDWALKFLDLKNKSSVKYKCQQVIKRWCFPRDQEEIFEYAKKLIEMKLTDKVFFLFDSEAGGEGVLADNLQEINDFIAKVHQGNFKTLDPSLNVKFILAGGLNPENVDQCLDKCTLINGVDVSSGVEDPLTGEKDFDKITNFVNNL